MNEADEPILREHPMPVARAMQPWAGSCYGLLSAWVPSPRSMRSERLLCREQREARLERVVRAGVEARRWGLSPEGPAVRELYGPGRWAVHETRAELERNWRMDDAVRDRQVLPGDPTTEP